MNKTKVIQQLKTLGTAQNRKTYSRHGVQGDQYGVSYANLNKLKKKIKADHDLAQQLWVTGNHDARVLATMIADPRLMNASRLNAWAKDLENYVLTDAFARLAARSPAAVGCIRKWTAARGEWKASAGWDMVAHLALEDDTLSDDFLQEHLATIEADIHGSKNRVRQSMNAALISIGLRNKAFERKAIAAAKRIGPVEVDHGDTSCKTPDAVAYIQKAAAHRRKKKAQPC